MAPELDSCAEAALARGRSASPAAERIRVLHVIASSAFGGAERVVAATLKTLNRDRFHVALACDGHGPMLEEYRHAADEVWPLDFPTVFSARGLAALTRLMVHLRVQIVHTHLWSADVLGGFAANLAGVRVRVATVHGGYFQVVDERGGRRARKQALSRVFRSTYGLFDRVIAVSDELARDLTTRSGVRVAPAKVAVIHNGLDLSRVTEVRASAARATLGLDPGTPLITTVANFVPMKGHRHLVAAMPKVLERWPAATFLLVGTGGELPAIQRLVSATGLGARVRFLGARDDARDLVAASDVLVLPSVAAEGLPITIIEALALGCPVVATRVGGIPEIVEEGQTGLLVPPRDAAALADAIGRVLSERAAVARMVARGREAVRTGFSAEQMTARLEQVYRELVSAAGTAGSRAPGVAR